MSERIQMRVLCLFGDQAELVTPDYDPGDPAQRPERVEAAWITRDTGIAREKLPGSRVTALVEAGELIGFEAATL